jgi:hypothetical protein
VQTADDSPYAVELEIRIASSMSLNRITGETGPNVSVRTTSISGVT